MKQHYFRLMTFINGSCFVLAIMMWERRCIRLVLFLSLFKNHFSRMWAGQ